MFLLILGNKSYSSQTESDLNSIMFLLILLGIGLKNAIGLI